MGHPVYRTIYIIKIHDYIYLSTISTAKMDCINEYCGVAVMQEMLKPLVEIALQISQLRELTGRNEPNVIT